MWDLHYNGIWMRRGDPIGWCRGSGTKWVPSHAQCLLKLWWWLEDALVSVTFTNLSYIVSGCSIQGPFTPNYDSFIHSFIHSFIRWLTQQQLIISGLTRSQPYILLDTCKANSFNGSWLHCFRFNSHQIGIGLSRSQAMIIVWIDEDIGFWIYPNMQLDSDKGWGLGPFSVSCSE